MLPCSETRISVLHVLLHSFQWLNEQFDRGNVTLNQPEEGALHPQIQPVARLKMCSQQVHRANVHCIFLYMFGQPHRLDRQHQHILILLPSWPSSMEIHSKNTHKDLHIYICRRWIPLAAGLRHTGSSS